MSTQFDDNGINIRFMNSTVEGNNVRDSLAASSIAQQVRVFGHESASVTPQALDGRFCSNAGVY